MVNSIFLNFQIILILSLLFSCKDKVDGSKPLKINYSKYVFIYNSLDSSNMLSNNWDCSDTIVNNSIKYSNLVNMIKKNGGKIDVLNDFDCELSIRIDKSVDFHVYNSDEYFHFIKIACVNCRTNIEPGFGTSIYRVNDRTYYYIVKKVPWWD